jgi:dihydroorotase
VSVTLVGGRVVDPATGLDAITNVVIGDGRVRALGSDVEGRTVDVGGCVVAPGLVDVHTHLREPGGEESETIASGTAAAVAGGFTAVFAMANTSPVPDHAEVIHRIRATAADDALCAVHPVGAITQGLDGEHLADIAGLAAAGVRYLSDDGRPVASARVMREALHQASAHGCIVGNHAEEPTLTRDAQVNEGPVSELLDMPGWPHEAEEVMIARDVLLARGLRARLHVPHVSTAASVAIIRWAKSRGMNVTAEVTPHHLTLRDELARTHDPVYKVNPPLRRTPDVDAVRQGLRDGTIDVIATDHAPHAPQKKETDWQRSPCGMLGLETAVGVALTELLPDTLTMIQLIRALSTRPAEIMGLDDQGGPIAPGAAANLVVFDPSAAWTVESTHLRSASRNSPFFGFRLTGRVIHTLVRGHFAYSEGAVVGTPPPPSTA